MKCEEGINLNANGHDFLLSIFIFISLKSDVYFMFAFI